MYRPRLTETEYNQYQLKFMSFIFVYTIDISQYTCISLSKEQGFDFVTHHISVCKSKSLEWCGVDGSADIQKRGRGDLFVHVPLGRRCTLLLHKMTRSSDVPL